MTEFEKVRVRVYPTVEKDKLRYICFEFDTIAEVKAAHESVATMLLFLQDELKVMPDSDNVFEYEIKYKGVPEWEPIEEEELDEL